MGFYLKLFFQGIFSKGFWKDRIDDFRQMLIHPGDYFKSLDKKENETRAYLLGMASTFAAWVGVTVVYILTFGLFTLGKALVFLPVLIVVGLVCWLIGLFLLYHLGTWSFAIAYKWLTQKDETKRIRPILFALCTSGLTAVVPGFGGFLSLVIFVVYLVIAYESVLKIARGSAIGSAVVGLVLLSVVMGFPFALIGWAFMALCFGTNGLAGLGLLAALFHPQPSSDGYDFNKMEKETNAAVSASMPQTQANTLPALTTTPVAAQTAAPPPPTPTEVPKPTVKTVKKHKTKTHAATSSSQNSGEAADTSSVDNSSTAQAKPAAKKDDAVGKAVGDAVGDAAKSLGF